MAMNSLVFTCRGHWPQSLLQAWVCMFMQNKNGEGQREEAVERPSQSVHFYLKRHEKSGVDIFSCFLAGLTLPAHWCGLCVTHSLCWPAFWFLLVPWPGYISQLVYFLTHVHFLPAFTKIERIEIGINWLLSLGVFWWSCDVTFSYILFTKMTGLWKNNLSLCNWSLELNPMIRGSIMKSVGWLGTRRSQALKSGMGSATF